MPDVLLINAAFGGLVGRGRRHNRCWPPLDLLNCAALLRQMGLSVELADARARGLGLAELRRRAVGAGLVLADSSPLDRWQCPNLELDAFCAMVRGLGRPDVVVCGAHGTLAPGRVLRQSGAAALIIGEPEAVVPGLVRHGIGARTPGLAWLEGGELRLSDPAPRPELEPWPVPAFDLAPPGDYAYELLGPRLALVETARGCPGACAFCLKAMYGPGVRYKTIAQVLAELEAARRAGARRAYFMDLDFAADAQRALELCRAVAEARLGLEWCAQARAEAVNPELLAAMAAAGCRLVHYGVETASPRLLRRLGKPRAAQAAARAVAWTRRYGMASACFFLFGLPGETRGQRGAGLALAKALKAEYASFHQVTPYPGTALHRRMGGDVFGDPAPPEPELGAFLRRAYLDYYLRPGQWLRMARAAGPGGIAGGLRLLAGLLGAGGA